MNKQQLLEEHGTLVKEIVSEFIDVEQYHHVLSLKPDFEGYVDSHIKPAPLYKILAFRLILSKDVTGYKGQDVLVAQEKSPEDNGPVHFGIKGKGFYYTEKELIARLAQPHSLQRLNDGEIFTVGDVVRDSLSDHLTGDANQVIDAFWVHEDHNNKTSVRFKSGTTTSIMSCTRIKPTYEIIAYAIGPNAKAAIRWKNAEGTFSWSADYCFTGKKESDLKKDKCYVPYAAKRLSDGVVFKLGDRVDIWIERNDEPDDVSCWETGNISNLDPIENTGALLIDTHNNFFCNIDYEKLKHSPKPVFVTEDQVEVFADDTIWFVNMFNYQIDHMTIGVTYDRRLKAHLKYFSVKDAAEDHLIQNKPCLSLNDVKDTIHLTPGSESLLWDLAKEKLHLN
jgi:hypothetical protein